MDLLSSKWIVVLSVFSFFIGKLYYFYVHIAYPHVFVSEQSVFQFQVVRA